MTHEQCFRNCDSFEYFGVHEGNAVRVPRRLLSPSDTVVGLSKVVFRKPLRSKQAAPLSLFENIACNTKRHQTESQRERESDVITRAYLAAPR